MKEVPKDAYEAFYEGCGLDDNPFPEWNRDYLEVAKHYKEEGRSR